MIVPPLKVNEKLYEVVDGRLLELSSWTPLAGVLAGQLSSVLWKFLATHTVGQVFQLMPFDLAGDGSSVRRPAVGFVPFDRWRSHQVPETEAWVMVPALAAEVVSAPATTQEVRGRIHDLLRHGVNLAWIMDAGQRVIDVHEGLKRACVLDVNDTLDGGTVLPGFRLPVSKLFEILPRAQV